MMKEPFNVLDIVKTIYYGDIRKYVQDNPNYEGTAHEVEVIRQELIHLGYKVDLSDVDYHRLKDAEEEKRIIVQEELCKLEDKLNNLRDDYDKLKSFCTEPGKVRVDHNLQWSYKNENRCNEMPTL